MAAHMHKVLRTLCAEKSRISRKEFAVSQSLIARFLSKSADSTSSPTETSSSKEIKTQVHPNQSNVEPFPFPEVTDAPAPFRGFRSLPKLINAPKSEVQSSFAKLFRESNFVHLGNPRGKVVYGTVYRIVGDDLYIDFDWKFPCVVKKPEVDAHLYVTSAVVRLRILDLEMSTIFLGAEKETSLNEANCLLLGLVSSPLGVPQRAEAYS